MKIRTRIVGMGATVAALAGLVTGTVLLVKQREVERRIAEVDHEIAGLQQDLARGQAELLEGSAAEVVRAVWHSVEASEQRTAADLNHALSVARATLQQQGGLRFDDRTIAWQATNQFTKASETVELPAAKLGEVALGMNDDPAVDAGLVDFVKEHTRDACTIFQRMNDAGDMLRISTSVIGMNGRRAIGTYIPTRLPDGGANPVIQTVLAGRTFRGRAQVVDEICATAYEPIWNDDRTRVVGMLFVGVPLNAITTELRQSLQELRIGRSGYVFVLQGSGPRRGTFIVSPGGQRDGESIWNAEDEAGRRFIQSMVEQAIAAGGQRVTMERYDWPEPGDTRRRRAFSAALYHPANDWVIAAQSFEDDNDQARAMLAHGMDRILDVAHGAAAEFRQAGAWTLTTALVMVSLSIAIGWWVARGIGRRLDASVRFAQDLAQGDLTGHLPAGQADEIDVLATAMNDMGERLREAFVRVGRTVDALNQSSEKLSSVSASVSAVAQKTANQAQAVATSSDEINRSVASVASASEEMSATIREMAERSAHAARVVSGAAQVAQQTDATVSKLGISSNEIGSVIRVITSIAEQTNLLALNATIEAARAGAAGRGFAVVANEVKELARQTAVATGEIQGKISAIQADSLATAEAMRQIASIVSEINAIQTSIAAATEEQAVTMNEISRSSAAASHETSAIAKSIAAVSDTARSTTGSATSTSAAARELARLGTELRELVASFKFDAAEGEKKSTTSFAAKTAARPPTIAWDPARMSTGVASIDEQHRELIRRINHLEEAIVRCAGAEEIEPMLKFLEDYTRSHFSFEEGLMEKHACPAKGANLAAHKKFLENLNRLVAEFRTQGPTLEVLDTLKRDVGAWLVNHVCGVDKKLGGCRGAIAAAARAEKRKQPVAVGG